MTTTAILTGAGSGSRLGAAVPKALLPINGVPMVQIAAVNLFASGIVDEIIVTVPPGWLDQFTTALAGIDIPIRLTVGGETRQTSIANALDLLGPGTGKVLVHDAARPFAPPELIHDVAAAINGNVKAVIPALPVTDTIKSVTLLPENQTGANNEPSELVARTLERATLRAVQTPQGFDRATLVQAYRYAIGQQITATDDASLVEAMGVPVKVIAGADAAMKITTPADLKIATLLYAS